MSDHLRRIMSAPALRETARRPPPHHMDRGTKLTLAACALVFGAMLYFAPPDQRRYYPSGDVGSSAANAASSNDDSEPALRFVVMGDYGTGTAAQRAVAVSLNRHAASFHPAFVLSTGDSLYPAGAHNARDVQFQDKFEHMYDGHALQIPFYMSLGNHDCWGDVDAQVAYTQQSLRWRMPARYYVTEHPLPPHGTRRDQVLRIITLDACLLVCGDMPQNHSSSSSSGGGGGSDIAAVRAAAVAAAQREDAMAAPADGGAGRCETALAHSVSAAAKAAQYAWLDDVLAASASARWLVVVSHWPVFSQFGNGPTPQLAAELLPRLRRHGVHVLFTGHDHALQHWRLPDAPFPQFFGSGAGGYALHPDLKPQAAAAVNADAGAVPLYARAAHGFFEVRATHTALYVTARHTTTASGNGGSGGGDAAAPYEAVLAHPSADAGGDPLLHPQYP